MLVVDAFQGRAGRGEEENLRGGSKKRINQLIQKFDKSAEVVTGGILLQYSFIQSLIIW